MRKPLAILIVLLMLCLMFPSTAFAAALLISTDGTHDISGYGSITISEGITVTLTNSGGATLTNVTIECIGPNTTLTLNGMKIDNSAYDNKCALSFTGAGNTLNLVGNSVLNSGKYEPGIRGRTTLRL